jgi:hypothetical protein
MKSNPFTPPVQKEIEMLFSIAVGCPVFILYAAFFHNSLLGSSPHSSGPTIPARR